jgi:hypothetical protein
MSASVIARVAMRVVGGADSYYAGFRLETCATFFLQVVDDTPESCAGADSESDTTRAAFRRAPDAEDFLCSSNDLERTLLVPCLYQCGTCAWYHTVTCLRHGSTHR